MKKTKQKKWNAKSVSALRKRLGLTQTEFAEALGINRQQTISDWECGLSGGIRPAHRSLLNFLESRAKDKTRKRGEK